MINNDDEMNLIVARITVEGAGLASQVQFDQGQLKLNQGEGLKLEEEPLQSMRLEVLQSPGLQQGMKILRKQNT